MHIPFRDLPPALQEKISRCLLTDFIMAKRMRDDYEDLWLKNTKTPPKNDTSSSELQLAGSNEKSHAVGVT